MVQMLLSVVESQHISPKLLAVSKTQGFMKAEISKGTCLKGT
uniref:Uncharacterized protein n=1 Tax=Anguilla anguilla TaxID=7936 RepID=A0A0E9RUK2_ANGAN